MDSIDLDINNYDYDEIFNLFKLTDVNNRDYISSELNKKMSTIKDKYPDKIYKFYYKARIIILAIFDILESNVINSNEERNNYLEKIKNIPDLDKFDENQLFDSLLDLNQIYGNKIIKNEGPSNVNTPHYNVNSRINPSLNNKNNTNEVFNSFDNAVAPGDLNSFKRVTQLLNLNINSCFRSNYYQNNASNFLYFLPTEMKKVVSLRLVSIEIPNSWYLFSCDKKNNIFEVIIHKDGIDSPHLITIPEGNYSNELLEDFLNKTYFYESHENNILKFLKFNIDPYSLRTCFQIIEVEDEKLIPFSFSLKFSMNIGQNIMNSAGWIMGFRLGNYVNIETIYSEGLFDAGGDRYIYLAIRDFQYNNNVSNIVCFDQSILNEDVVAKIPMVNGKLSLIINDNDNSLAKVRRYNGPVNLSRLQIKLLDQFGSLIDLNNMDYSITLELEILYENFNFKNII
jgi:hypothetical protein